MLEEIEPGKHCRKKAANQDGKDEIPTEKQCAWVPKTVSLWGSQEYYHTEEHIILVKLGNKIHYDNDTTAAGITISDGTLEYCLPCEEELGNLESTWGRHDLSGTSGTERGDREGSSDLFPD